MLLEVSNERAWTALLVLAEFGCIALLGFLLVQLMHWEMLLKQGRSVWLPAMREGVWRLRTLRRQLDKMEGEWPGIPLNPAFKRKWQVARWLFKAVSAVKWARS